MLFSSFNFLVFFVVLFLFYRFSNLKTQKWLLFFGGVIFYSSFEISTLPILFFTILFNFWIGKKIFTSKNYSKTLLIFGIFINISILVFFKYFLFIQQIFIDLKLSSHILTRIVLPLGISFYTFHNLCYIIDIYNGVIPPATSLLTFAIYDLFFPLLLAGPIERAKNLIPQIESHKTFSFMNYKSGIFLFLVGFVKKTVVGDHLGELIEKAFVWENPKGFSFWFCIVMAFHVYGDFSGYSDMARGLARILGFELSLNFQRPFFSKNPIEFWKRWHISLSSWLRDYLYIPLGGNRKGFLWKNVNLLIVWMLGGLWHGAGYGYIFWGFYCGIQVIIYHNLESLLKYLENKSTKIYLTLKFFKESLEFPLLAFGYHVISFGFGLLFFKINSMQKVLEIINNFFPLYWNFVFFSKLLFFLFPLLLIDVYQSISLDENFEKLKINSIFGLGFLFILVFYSLLFSYPESKEFFYFQF